MTDIVQILRGDDPALHTSYTEAADEIERLRQQLVAANRTLDETAPWRELQADNKRLQQQLAECERERDEADYEKGRALEALATVTKERDELVEENHALKSLVGSTMTTTISIELNADKDQQARDYAAGLAKGIRAMGTDKTAE